MPSKLFISYSHDDEKFAKPIVQLLRVSAKYVFFDRDTLKPGKNWADQIQKAIESVQLVVVIWCKHASLSAYVKQEYLAAIKKEKDLMPVLLDDTPLPKPLAAFQWIDFRQSVEGTHEYTPVDDLLPPSIGLGPILEQRGECRNLDRTALSQPASKDIIEAYRNYMARKRNVEFVANQKIVAQKLKVALDKRLANNE
ncbi:toll/interleukin-1 receptor domain-containing protein [Spirosoma validum]|uniref:Toll/interleukin-1 receptor domain-containing protein n=1 Tax=Spirosoma validum TaxID=2771355 RepID=A0A927GC20_9BACT|nr:toll/interleukin-1 receptor domain-containing protein [Spirosoma validum]MBD2752302.1 toll/interleukin-1 receptor domain-containing protein [Spirosoma validum]